MRNEIGIGMGKRNALDSQNVTGACRTALLAISFALSGLAGPTLGAPILNALTRTVEVDRDGNINSDAINSDSNSGLTPGEVVQSSINSATAQARADFGSLGIHAHMVMSDGQQQIVAQATSSWTDTVHISSNNPAVNTVRIQVDLEINIDALTSTVSGPSGDKFAYGLTQFVTNFVPGNGWCVMLNAGLHHECPAGYAPLTVGRNLIQYVMEDVPVGDHGFQAGLIGEAQILDSLIATMQTSGEVLVDAFNTAHTYFTVLTPGAAITWDSGHDYSAPLASADAPAPATLALLGLGLVLAGLGRSRRRK